jgi:hypothetical protein
MNDANTSRTKVQVSYGAVQNFVHLDYRSPREHRNTSSLYSTFEVWMKEASSDSLLHGGFPRFLPDACDLFLDLFDLVLVASSFVVRYLSLQLGNLLLILPVVRKQYGRERGVSLE